MKVLVSACLLGENCKYNGKNNRNEAVLRFVEDKEVISICPELLTGLGACGAAGGNVPRILCRF